jgi:hypothetical protein
LVESEKAVRVVILDNPTPARLHRAAKREFGDTSVAVRVDHPLVPGFGDNHEQDSQMLAAHYLSKGQYIEAEKTVSYNQALKDAARLLKTNEAEMILRMRIDGDLRD